MSASQLDPRNVRASLTTLGCRFLELVLSPDAIALHRIIVGEVTRFPVLGEVFGAPARSAPGCRSRLFCRRAAAFGGLDFGDLRVAAEQFVTLVRGEIHLRQLLRLEPDAGEPEMQCAVEGAVETFVRAFGTRQLPAMAGRPGSE